ncbi:unnamed protein product, partial [Linum tenue]
CTLTISKLVQILLSQHHIRLLPFRDLRQRDTLLKKVKPCTLRRSVEITCEAREAYNKRCEEAQHDIDSSGNVLKQRPIIVAASVESYGAYLADGSEYSGIYGEAVSLETLKEFHRRRLKILAESGADLIAFETIPNKVAAQAYVELLEEEDIEVPAWFAFYSKDDINVVVIL